VFDYDLHTRAPAPLVEAARRQRPGYGLAALVRLGLAMVAGWPVEAAQTVARPRNSTEREAD
jgi:hypothetical protein